MLICTNHNDGDTRVSYPRGNCPLCAAEQEVKLAERLIDRLQRQKSGLESQARPVKSRILREGKKVQ